MYNLFKGDDVLSKERKDLIVSVQFLVINSLNALFAGGLMQIGIVSLLDGQKIPLDSLKHILVFLAILIPSVFFGYVLWILFTLISLLVIIEIDRINR